MSELLKLAVSWNRPDGPSFAGGTCKFGNREVFVVIKG